MALITPGDGGTIKSGTLEGQILEAAAFARIQELDANKNSQSRNYITSFSLNPSVFSCSISFPLSQSFNDAGQPVFSVPDYLVGVSFSPGIGGRFKSTNFAAYIVELILSAQELERTPAKNPTQSNYMDASFSTEDPMTFSASVILPVTMSLSNNKPIFEAVEYLIA